MTEYILSRSEAKALIHARPQTDVYLLRSGTLYSVAVSYYDSLLTYSGRLTPDKEGLEDAHSKLYKRLPRFDLVVVEGWSIRLLPSGYTISLSPSTKLSTLLKRLNALEATPIGVDFADKVKRLDVEVGASKPYYIMVAGSVFNPYLLKLGLRMLSRSLPAEARLIKRSNGTAIIHMFQRKGDGLDLGFFLAPVYIPEPSSTDVMVVDVTY